MGHCGKKVMQMNLNKKTKNELFTIYKIINLIYNIRIADLRFILLLGFYEFGLTSGPQSGPPT